MNITFSYKGENYTLEFDRDVIYQMAQKGLTNDFITSNADVVLPDLFYHAFLKHHRHVGRKLAEEMLGKIKDRERFFVTLYEIYRAPLEALFEEPTEDEGNIEWEVSKTH